MEEQAIRSCRQLNEENRPQMVYRAKIEPANPDAMGADAEEAEGVNDDDVHD